MIVNTSSVFYENMLAEIISNFRVDEKTETKLRNTIQRQLQKCLAILIFAVINLSKYLQSYSCIQISLLEAALQYLHMSVQREVIKTMKCPFDPAHIMPYQRFLNHLDKCKFPDKKSYRKCKFNPYHVEHMDNIEHHQKTCPDSKKYEKEEEDWGVVQVPNKKVAINKYNEESSQALSSSNYSSSYTKSLSSKNSQNKVTDNYKIQGEKVVLNKTHIEVCDLEDFTSKNVPKVKPNTNKYLTIVQDLDVFNPNS